MTALGGYGRGWGNMATPDPRWTFEKCNGTTINLQYLYIMPVYRITVTVEGLRLWLPPPR